VHPPAAIAGLRDGNLGGRWEPTGYHQRCPLDVGRWPLGGWRTNQQECVTPWNTTLHSTAGLVFSFSNLFIILQLSFDIFLNSVSK